MADLFWGMFGGQPQYEGRGQVIIGRIVTEEGRMKTENHS